jgi:hypothetical protein
MSSADFLLYKPLQLSGAVSFTRPSPKWVYDRTGTLVEVPANTLGVTYDPADLSKAPWALLEPAATNLLRYSEQFDNGAWGRVGAAPTANSAIAPTGVSVACKLIESAANTGHFIYQSRAGVNERVTLSVFAKAEERSWVYLSASNFSNASLGAHFNLATGSVVSVDAPNADYSAPMASIQAVGNGWFRCILSVTKGAVGANNYAQINIGRTNDPTSALLNYLGDGVSGLYLWGAQMVAESVAMSYIRTLDVPVTRAADVVGAGSGLVYSSVAITEPLWVAGIYAQGAKVRDGDNFVFESLASSNSAPLTEKTKWLPLGKTNQLKMFDKAVNSQTTAPDSLTVVVKPGQLANTLTLLNVSGAEVTVTQSESGYTRQQALATHNVLSWYDFYYQEPQWIGDTVFADMPPYLNSLITVHVKSPGNIAGLGGFFLGRPKFIGKTQWGLKAGILSYSSQEADTFGNVTLMKRASAKKMNFEVAVPRGYEDEVYRFMTAADNEEMIAIASTNWAMTLSYGYLGQWELPLGIEGEKMPVEWRGLI